MLITDVRALPIVKTFCSDAQNWLKELPRGATAQDAYESTPYCDWLLYVLINTGVLSQPKEERLKKLIRLPPENCVCPMCMSEFVSERRDENPTWNIHTMSKVRKEFPWTEVGQKILNWMEKNE